MDGAALVWRGGTRTPLQHAQAASYPALLDHPGLLDQLAARYPACQPLHVPAWKEDPGRGRAEAFFSRMYGDSPAQVAPRLDTINWFGQPLRVNGAAALLRAVAADLARQPGLRPYARRSVHAYGAATDLNLRFSDSWLWKGDREGQRGIRDRNRMPPPPCMCSSATGGSGAGAGTTMTRCTSSTAQN